MKGRRDDRNYVQSNGRHLNKRESDNPNFRRNYNINNKHINEYRGYGSHPNSHRGSQINHSNGNYNDNYNYNLNRNKRQGPLNDHPDDNFNRDVNFLEYRRNPTDWPTLVEERLLKPLMELLRGELENWGPARL